MKHGTPSQANRGPKIRAGHTHNQCHLLQMPPGHRFAPDPSTVAG